MPNAIITLPDGRRARVSGETREAVQAQIDTMLGQANQRTVGDVPPELVGRTMDPKGTPVQGFMGQVMRGIGLDPRVPTPEVQNEIAGKAQADPYMATVDTMATLGTGTAAMPVAGLAGIAGTVGGMMPGGESPSEKGNRYLQATAGALTNEPSTQGAQLVLDQQADVAEKIQTRARDFNFDNPILATLVETAVLGAATLPAGVKLNTSRILQRESKRYVDDMAARLGVDIGSSKMREQLGDAARDRTVGFRGENMAAIQAKLQSEYAAAQAKTKAAYDAAGETRAAVRIPSVDEFLAGLKVKLAGFDVEEMSALKRLVGETERAYRRGTEYGEAVTLLPEPAAGTTRLYGNGQAGAGGQAFYTDIPDEAIRLNPKGIDYADVPNAELGKYRSGEHNFYLPDNVGTPVDLGVRLSQLETLRQRTNKTYGPNDAQGKAMGMYRRALDAQIKAEFDRDMILGDPKAVQAWKNARLTREMQGELFNDNDVIMRLIEREATSTEMRQWILGASSTGLGLTKSARVVDQLKRILGEKSPEFKGLKEEYRYDIMEPLLRPTPDFGTFLKNYDRAYARNRPLMDALKPFDTDHMDELVRMVRAAEKTGADPNLSLNLNRIMSQAFFGHEIAQAAMRRSLAEAVISRLRGTAMSGKRKMYQELMGYDPNRPMIPKNSLAFAAIMAGNQNDVFSTDLPPEEEAGVTE